MDVVCSCRWQGGRDCRFLLDVHAIVLLLKSFVRLLDHRTKHRWVDQENGGDVYVVDTNNHRVQKFDGKLGGYLMKFGSRGNAEGQFSSPWGIAVDRTTEAYFIAVPDAVLKVTF